jgi:hypothetical protein
VHYDTPKDFSRHDALTRTDVMEVLPTSLQRRRQDASSQRWRNMEIRSPLEFVARSPRTWSENATIPYSIVQATQFFEFFKGIAHFSM